MIKLFKNKFLQKYFSFDKKILSVYACVSPKICVDKDMKKLIYIYILSSPFIRAVILFYNASCCVKKEYLPIFPYLPSFFFSPSSPSFFSSEIS